MSLSGKRIVVTRPASIAAPFVVALRSLGAEPVLLPAIRICAPLDTAALDAALLSVHCFDWVVFTSANTVSAVVDRLSALDADLSPLKGRRLAAIGPATAEALELAVREPDLVPPEFVAESLVGAFSEVEGLRFFLPGADVARPELADGLRARGGCVTVVVAYTVQPEDSLVDVGQPCPDYITFASGSAVRSTVENFRKAGVGEWLDKASIVCIGPVTADEVRELGLHPAAVADEHTADGLVRALQQLELSDASV